MIEDAVPDFAFAATFRLFGLNLGPGAITEALGVSPSFSCLAGEKFGALQKPASRGTWQYTAQIDDTEPFDRHAIALWSRLGPAKTEIDRLRLEFDADVRCSLRSNLDWSEFVISPAASLALASFGLPVSWSIIVLPD